MDEILRHPWCRDASTGGEVALSAEEAMQALMARASVATTEADPEDRDQGA